MKFKIGDIVVLIDDYIGDEIHTIIKDEYDENLATTEELVFLTDNGNVQSWAGLSILRPVKKIELFCGKRNPTPVEVAQRRIKNGAS